MGLEVWGYSPGLASIWFEERKHQEPTGKQNKNRKITLADGNNNGKVHKFIKAFQHRLFKNKPLLSWSQEDLNDRVILDVMDYLV